MLRILFIACVLTLISESFKAQEITYNNTVGEIINSKCGACHRNNAIAPFSLLSYTEVKLFRNLIANAIEEEIMPPWPPDSGFHFVHERRLSPEEKQNILNWVESGAPEGDQPQPLLPKFPDQGYLGKGDLSVQIPTYRSKAHHANGEHIDDYVCFTLPTGLTTSRIIQAMEVFPGDREIVHHALVYIDTIGNYKTDTVGNDCGGPSQASLVGGYVPGSSPAMFANSESLKMGMTIPAGANIILAMHYPAESEGKLDSTRVEFHFYPDSIKDVREVSAAALVQNWDFSFDPSETERVSAKFPPLGITKDYTLLSVFPHMHLLGQSIEAYNVPPGSTDTTNLIRISEWDFDWQDFYTFKNPIKIPAFSTIGGSGLYHNNTDKVVTAGDKTTDEMFLIYFQFTPYEAGDELIDMDSLLAFPIEWIAASRQNFTPHKKLKVFPNPSTTGEITIDLPTDIQTEYQVTLYNLSGGIAARKKYVSSEAQQLTISIPIVGSYFLSLSDGVEHWNTILTIQ